MKKYWKLGMASVMAGMLLISGMTAQATVVNNKIDSKTELQENVSKNSKKDISDLFFEGEVLVMYGDEHTKAKALSDNSLGSNMTIEETYSFDVEDPKLGARGISSTTGNICVSLVKSDTLSTAEMMKQLKKNPSIRCVQPNMKFHAMSTDLSNYQWPLNNVGQNAGTKGMDMNPEVASAMASDDKSEKIIAIVDSGVDYLHPDLIDRMWKNPYAQSQLKGDYGYDFVNNDTDPMDDNGHGTHCAGIAAANVNGEGISGIAAADNVKIMALKILEADGSCSGMEVVGAYNFIYRAQKLGSNVVAVNNSWGATITNETLEYYGISIEEYFPEMDIFSELMSLVGEKGALSLCAAGNEHTDIDNDAFSYPSNLDNPYIINVAASNEKGEPASFSNYGVNQVDVVAPGTDIISTVCYDNFYPTIYSKDEVKDQCVVFEDFEDEENTKSDESLKLNLEEMKSVLPNNQKIGYSIVDNEFYGPNAEGKSMKFELEAGDTVKQRYTWFVPFESPQGEGEYFVSGDCKIVDNTSIGHDGDKTVCQLAVVTLPEEKEPDAKDVELISPIKAGNYWSHAKPAVLDNGKSEGQRYLAITLVPATQEKVELYIDNIGISKRVQDTSVFGKYENMNGTSMATPYVSGSVAAIAQIYPDMSALERKNLILSCCNRMDSLAGICNTSGVLDLALVKSPNMQVMNVNFDENNNIVINGKYLEGTTVTINEEVVTPISVKDEQIVISGKGHENYFAHILVKKGNEMYETSVFVPKASIIKQTATTTSMCDAGLFTTDGNAVYGMEQFGSKVYILNDKDDSMVWKRVVGPCATEVFGEEYRTYDGAAIITKTEPVVCDGRIYAILTMDAGFCQESMLVGADLNGKGKWEAVSQIPDVYDNLEGVAIAAYDGFICLLGGYNEDTDSFVKDVYAYSLHDNSKWSKMPDLPEARGFSKAIQTGKMLVVTVGACDTKDTFPKNLIYDGKNWTVSKATFTNALPNTFYQYSNNPSEEEAVFRGFGYYDANVALMEGGILYQGYDAVGFGNIFQYNLEKDSFQVMDFASGITDYDVSQGIAVINDEFRLYNVNRNQKRTEKYVAKVKSGFLKASVKCVGGATVQGIKIWLPCDQIQITASAKEETYIESFIVNGADVKADAKKNYVFTGKASDYSSDLKVEANAVPYIKTIQLDTQMDIIIGGEAQLNPVVIPDTIVNPKLKWTSSDPSVATVDEKGVVKVSEHAIVGTTAVINVVAADRGTVKATCKITVIGNMAEVPAKGSKKTVGKLSYKITKADAKSGTVSCVKMTNKSLTKLTIPATVKINGYTFKVTKIEANAFKSSKKLKTVVIGKNVTSIGKGAFKSCKKLTSVTIKSSGIKTIGKDAFKSVNKKCAIKTPKKKKNAYKKLLTKSGYKYKVK